MAEIQPFQNYFAFIKVRDDKEKLAEKVAAFEKDVENFETFLAIHQDSDGPFLCGGSVGLADATYLPFLERWAVQLPLTSGFALRPEEGEPPRWPQIEGWFVAMAEEPAYARVRGDTYSWSAAVAAFQRIFATNGTLSDAQRAVSRRACSGACCGRPCGVRGRRRRFCWCGRRARAAIAHSQQWRRCWSRMSTRWSRSSRMTDATSSA